MGAWGRSAPRRDYSRRFAVFRAWLLISMTALGVFMLPATRAAADQNPPGCTQNNLALDIGRDKTIVRNGETILYTISAANVDSAQGPACNFSATTFTFSAPAADGTPTGKTTVLRSDVDFPAGTTRTVLGQVPYVVAVTGSAPPLTAVFTYVERNDSSTPVPMVSVTVTDDGCSPVVYAAGDANGNHVLDPGEAWAFGCSRRITTPGTFVEHVAAGGIDVEDNRAGPPEATQVSATVQSAQVLPAARGPLKGAIPVTGLALPVTTLGALGLVLIGVGAFLGRKGPLRKR